MKTLLFLQAGFGFVLFVLFAGDLPAGTNAYPRWWIDRGVVSTSAVGTNDFAAANMGQLKWFATNAYNELNSKLPGGAGSAIGNMVKGFSLQGNFCAVNMGQLKGVTKPFYDRLNAYMPLEPWWGATITNDYAWVNVGQLKSAFSFEPTYIASQQTYIWLDRSGLPGKTIGWASGRSSSGTEEILIDTFDEGYLQSFWDSTNDWSAANIRRGSAVPIKRFPDNRCELTATFANSSSTSFSIEGSFGFSAVTTSRLIRPPAFKLQFSPTAQDYYVIPTNILKSQEAQSTGTVDVVCYAKTGPYKSVEKSFQAKWIAYGTTFRFRLYVTPATTEFSVGYLQCSSNCWVWSSTVNWARQWPLIGATRNVELAVLDQIGQPFAGTSNRAWTVWFDNIRIAPGRAIGLLPGNDPDDDCDGLTNEEEEEIGTDPRKWDTDGDGYSDCEEHVLRDTDPTNPDTSVPTIVFTEPTPNTTHYVVP